MKFAKELDDELVPEWRAKYFDYKTGKKKLKAVTRALRSVNATPSSFRRRSPRDNIQASVLDADAHHSPHDRAPVRSFLRQNLTFNDREGSSQPLRPTAPLGHESDSRTTPSEDDQTQKYKNTPPIAIPEPPQFSRTEDGEYQPLHNVDGSKNYGSFIPTPPEAAPPPGPPSILELPDPALDPKDNSTVPRRLKQPGEDAAPGHSPAGHTKASSSASNHAYKIGKTHAPTTLGSKLRPHGHFFSRRTFSAPDGPKQRPFLHRILSSGGSFSGRRDGTPHHHHRDVPLEAYRDFDLRQAQFFAWMDQELAMIEGFYKKKEDEATERLHTLRDQLHEMRDRRLQQMAEAQRAAHKADHQSEGDDLLTSPDRTSADLTNGKSHEGAHHWFRPIGHALGNATGRPESRFGKTTKALQQLGTPSGPRPQSQPGHPDGNRDFVRRLAPDDEVSYRQAKRKLKLALAEYYRGLELLKSYALLNRTAFRKMNKKYDKAVQARPTGRYMSEKVNKAWFVQSAVLEGHMQAVEDLYARYFERGSHKIAVGKLRSKGNQAGAHHDSVYRNGLLIGAGMVFGIQAIVDGAALLSNPDPVVQLNASYLLQIYAGYFLALLLFLLFCLDCSIWVAAKINYVFIFEFDTRHHLDWRQLAEIPCFFFFLEGLFMWINFQPFGMGKMFIYWPVIFIGLSVLILFFPAKILYHRSRTWWLYSNWRLLLAGLYPVEFRDFFLGDMYCSETYSMGNLELFFCLYAQHWSNPGQCNSTHSRLLGFFSTVPGIWRALQCIRRYYDTRNVFPHLVNCGKYTFTILYYMSLSMYRIHETTDLKAFFIFCATTNSVYCSIWDVMMDFSLGNPYAKNPFLRDVLGYKWPWVYYVAMVLDPILRFNWIFYAIYADDLQHSALLSFFIALTEVCRRGMWTLFRVENEHTTNVGRFRASRDVPLPYELSPSEPSTPSHTPAAPATPSASALEHGQMATTTATPAGPQPASTTSSPSLRRRHSRHTPSGTPAVRGIARVGTAMAEAHAQDFERRRRPRGSSSHDDDDVDPAAGASARAAAEASSDEDESDPGAFEAVDEADEEDLRDAHGLVDAGRTV